MQLLFWIKGIQLKVISGRHAINQTLSLFILCRMCIVFSCKILSTLMGLHCSIHNLCVVMVQSLVNNVKGIWIALVFTSECLHVYQARYGKKRFQCLSGTSFASEDLWEILFLLPCTYSYSTKLGIINNPQVLPTCEKVASVLHTINYSCCPILCVIKSPRGLGKKF